MNHETLQALYALDVADVCEEEAAKRWEYIDWTVDSFRQCVKRPSWSANIRYRRKPGIPWPKVIWQNRESALQQFNDCGGGVEPSAIERLRFFCSLAMRGQDWLDVEQFFDAIEKQKQEWPADAPEWANAAIITWCKSSKELVIQGEQRLIERPKPVKQKIDWNKLPSSLSWVEYDILDYGKSKWIAWNCDEHTRGNPLPDGLVVEWYGAENLLRGYLRINWEFVTRFRIVGIQEGWE